MATSSDLVHFDIIESQKENIQALPGGRSARELARIFSSGKESDKFASPSLSDTRTMNDAIRQEYEAELQTLDESDDPLDVYDRYLKWTLNAYPSSQATPESGLLSLLERATKHFLSSPLYKNDPRYLRLWLHYIRLFSDTPRETFAFLARHHIGEGLALFYEEFAAWLENAGRWGQAEEVYQLGIEREARPTERLLRKFSEFRKRFEQRANDAGPSSPALPKVRPALAAKVDPFAATATTASDPQSRSTSSSLDAHSRSKSGKPKMSIFTDSGVGPVDQPPVGEQSRGWESIGFIRERRKENHMEPKPWARETLKEGKKPAPMEKMMIFRDESNRTLSEKQTFQLQQIPEHHVIRDAINSRTGRRERVFVNLPAVYPDSRNPAYEMSFEELRAISRGWMRNQFGPQKKALKQISANVSNSNHHSQKAIDSARQNDIPAQRIDGLVLDEKQAPDEEESIHNERDLDGSAGKVKKHRIREIRETQTIKMNFDSPAKSKVRRKSTAEPTMTIHTRAATDEIYSIFNQPLKAETNCREDDLCGSDYEDDDYTSAGESTCTGQASAASSEFGDDETNTLHQKSSFQTEDVDENTRTAELRSGEWTELTSTEHSQDFTFSRGCASPSTAPRETEPSEEDATYRPGDRARFVPEMPEDYDPPCGPYRDPEIVALNRLPFMTPIVEQTECSFPSMTAARHNMYNAKTPSKSMLANGQTSGSLPPIGDLLLSSPDISEKEGPYQNHRFLGIREDVLQSPITRLQLPPQLARSKAILGDTTCNPTDLRIRDAILDSLSPPLASYCGYHVYPGQQGDHGLEIQKYAKGLGKRAKSFDQSSFDTPILDFPDAERRYVIRRQLGAGAYAPVYLAESMDVLDNDSAPGFDEQKDRRCERSESAATQSSRFAFEAVKVEMGPPNPWEFYMIRAACDRLKRHPEYSRAADSVIRAHEIHIFDGETILVEDYGGQGTLLDLVNIIRTESVMGNNSEAGMDEALAMFFTVELFRTVEALHACGILHGDIKADNCLVRFDHASTAPEIPSLVDLDDDENVDPREVHYSPRGFFGWRNKGVALIDFGRGIDMYAFQPSVQFIADWETGKHECNEIREMRPWTHQIDLYGLAGTIHVMLFGKYIESTLVLGTGGRASETSCCSPNSSSTTSSGLGPQHRTYRIRETFKRYWDREIWSDAFDLLLNPGSDRWVQLEREGGPKPNLLQRQDEPDGRNIAGPAASLRDNGNENTSILYPVLPVLKSMKYVRQRMETWLVANAEKRNLSLQIRKLEALFAERRRKLEKC